MFTTRQAFELALQHHNEGRLREAETLYRQILSVSPNHADALHYLGVIAIQVGQHELAFKLVTRALQIYPNYTSAWTNLGEIHRHMGNLDEAIACQRRALEIQPDCPEAFTNLGIVLVFKDEIEQAVAALRRAVEVGPGMADPHHSLANALQRQGKLEEALAEYRQAIALQPDRPEFHWNAALALLSLGHFREGWEEFEWRLKLPHLARTDLTTPPWKGEDLAGKTLLIHQEGGFGDAIQFLRYLPMVRERGAKRIVFEGQAAILPWIKMQPGMDAVAERGNALPEHDFQCAPQSFPRVFGTESHNIPAAIPYLRVDENKVAAWRRKLDDPPYRDGDSGSCLFAGLCWAGSKFPRDDRTRTLETFAPLGSVPGVTFVSLQKGPEAARAAEAPAGLRLVDAAAEVGDFADLAALVSCLDVVISVDTAVAHLAGALGKPVWILLPWRADFRWLKDRADSPWYPTARLFRQRAAESWVEPVQEMGEALQHIKAALAAPGSAR